MTYIFLFVSCDLALSVFKAVIEKTENSNLTNDVTKVLSK